MTFVYFIIALSILIIAHELGHFLAARLSGITVEKFSIGFGPRLFGFKKGDTEYKVSILPFGGFVKMKGDEYTEVEEGDEGAYYNKSVWTRAKVVAAGPIMNLLLCMVLMPIVFMIGKSEPAFFEEVPQIIGVREDTSAAKAGLKVGDLVIKVEDNDVETWRDVLNTILVSINQDIEITIKRGDEILTKEVHVESMPDGRGGFIGIAPPLFIGNEATLDSIVGGSPADKAGLKAGDLVTSVNGKKIEDWTALVITVNESKGETLSVTVDRNGEKITTDVTPEYSKDYERYLMGISKDVTSRDIPMVKVRYGFLGSIKEGLSEVYELTGLTLTVLKKLVTLQLSYKALGGPIKIAQATAAAAQSGLGSFFYFLAFLSLQLGILNLMPIPVLDGGHLVFFGIEAVRGEPLSEKVIGVAQHVGLALILLLMATVTFNDLISLESVRNFMDKFF